MPLQSFIHVKLDVSDLTASLGFYRDLLQLREIVRYNRDDGVTIVQMSPSGAPPGIELWYEPPFRARPTDRLHIAFSATNVAGLIRDFADRGVCVDREPFRMGHEIIAFIRDPDGYLIELNEDTHSAIAQTYTDEKNEEGPGD
jgi:lactoylglutathione lyase